MTGIQALERIAPGLPMVPGKVERCEFEYRRHGTQTLIAAFDVTIGKVHKLFEQRGIEGLTSFDMGGSAGFLSTAQEDALKAFVGATLPRSTRQVGAWIEQEFGLVYESRSGLIALLHRLGLEYHKPNVIPAKLDEDKQKAFIENYEKLLNSLGDDEAVLFADAVHPTHAARPAGCWAPKQEKLAIEQTSGRDRINIHGAIDLATGQTRMIEVVTVDAVSTIRLLESIEALYPLLALIHVFLGSLDAVSVLGLAGGQGLPLSCLQRKRRLVR